MIEIKILQNTSKFKQGEVVLIQKSIGEILIRKGYAEYVRTKSIGNKDITKC